MKRMAWIATALVALVAAGVAVGHGFGSRSVKPVSATFDATSVSDVQTSICTASDGTSYVRSHGTYTGTASGDPTLSGPVTINASSLVNSTANTGIVNGRISIDVSGGHARATFNAVYANGSLAGIALGHAGPGGTQLVADISAGFSASGGFTSGVLGGISGGGAVEVTPGGCQPTPPPKPDAINARGTVSDVSPTSITAGGVTCTVPSNLQGAVSNIHQNDRVQMRCDVSNGQTTLVSISGDPGKLGPKKGFKGHHR
jgi:hypothetical protein